MSTQLHFFIDDQPVGQSSSFNELSTAITRDGIKGGLLITQDVKLRWYKGDNKAGEVCAYTYLKSLFNDSLCNEADIKIYFAEPSIGVTYLYYSGVIKIPDITFEEHQRYVDCGIIDNSFYSYINNNRTLEVQFRATESKNKVAITPLPQYSVDMFAGITGIYGSTIGARYEAYRVSDVFRFIIAAISDNKAGFRSDYLETASTQLYITKGQCLLNSFTLYPLAQVPDLAVSFDQLFNELNKLKNISFYIDYTNPDSPVLRLENFEALYGTDTGIAIIDPMEVKTSVNVNELYSNVNAGSEITIDGQSPQYTFNESTSYFGWKQESFHPLGQCNISRELDLVNEFIISNNVIQDALYGSTEQIDSYFLIEAVNVDEVNLTADAKQYDFFGSAPPYLYNLGLNNFNKISRHSGKFITNLGNWLGVGGNGFRALLGENQLNNITYSNVPSDPNFIPPAGLTIDAEFPNETTEGGYDGGGNYNNVAYEYIIPDNGDYSFTLSINFGLAGSDPVTAAGRYFRITTIINHYSSAMVLISSGSNEQHYFQDGGYTQQYAYVLSANSGEIVRAEIKIEVWSVFDNTGPVGHSGGGNYQHFQLNYTSYFECNGTPDGGITIASSSGAKQLFHELEYNFSDTQWRALMANPAGSVRLIKDGRERIAWLQTAKRNDWTGTVKIKLVSGIRS